MTRRTRNVIVRAAQVEPLESRRMLSLSPAGAEFRVNTFTTSAQSNPAIAADADGDFVVAWSGNGSGDTSGVFAQRYNAAGVAQGSEFRVNTFTTGTQGGAAAAMDADGDFVVTWNGNGTGDSSGVFGQRYNAAGVAQGGEFRVNTTTVFTQGDPSVAMNASGDFVITWTSDDGSSDGIFGQRYNAAGVAQGAEFRVNTRTTDTQRLADVAMSADGRFLVAWTSRFPVSGDPGGSGDEIYVQRYSAAGAPEGGEFHVNTFTSDFQGAPAVAMDASGDFVVTWDSATQDDPASNGIYAQRYSSVGVAQGSEFRVNTFTTGNQINSAVAMDADGDFVAAWMSIGQDGSSYGVYGQSFSAAGVPQGGEFRANTVTTAQQGFPAVTMDSDGNAVIVWRSNLQDGSGYGIYAQRYDESNPDTAAPMAGGVFVRGEPVMPGQRVDTASSLVLSFSENMSTSGGAAGANSASNRVNYRLTRNGVDVSAQITSASLFFSGTTNRFQTTLTFSTALINGSYVLTALDNLRDVAANALDGNLDGIADGKFTRAFSVVAPGPIGSNFRVNVTTASDQDSPAIGREANGDFVVVWRSAGQDGSGDGIYGRCYSAAGLALSAEFRVNSTTAGHQLQPAVAMDADGDFVVAWSGFGANDAEGVFARRFDANGLPQGNEFRVNTVATNSQNQPAVAMDADGDFVIAWTSYFQDGDFTGIYAQRYNASGVVQGAEFRVNTTTTDQQDGPTVAMDGDGDFVIAWQSGHLNAYDIFAQRYSAAGVPQGVEFLVDNSNLSASPSAAMDADGNFVIAWRIFFGGVFARRYSANGASLGGQIEVDPLTAGANGPPSVSMDTEGNFTIAWPSEEQADFNIYARRYPASGAALGSKVLVNTFTTGEQFESAVAMDADGDFVIAWKSEDQDGSGNGVFAQMFARLTEVNISEFVFQTAPHRVRFTFSDNVSSSLGTNDILLENLTTSTTIPSSDLALSYDSGTNVATFSYIGSASGITGVLPDGNYRATLTAAGITTPGGTPLPANHVFTFFFLNGDANHDGRVNLNDFNILAANFGQSPRNFTQGDFTYDGLVNLADFNILAGRFGQVLANQLAGSPASSRPLPFASKSVADSLAEEDPWADLLA